MNRREEVIRMIQDAVKGCARYWAVTIADYLIEHGAIVDRTEVEQEIWDRVRKELDKCNLISNGLQIGDTLYVIVEDGDTGTLSISSETVTEIVRRFIFTSAFVPPGDDLGNEIPIEEVGRTVFFEFEAAQEVLRCLEKT